MRTMRTTDLRVSGTAMALALAVIFGAARFSPETAVCDGCGSEAVPATPNVVQADNPADCDVVTLPSVIG